MEKTTQNRPNPSEFAQRVYTRCRQIPQGKVTTYKELARSLHCNSAQAVGQALRCNPYAPIVPCHRVVASNGSLGGFKGKKQGACIQEKQTLLKEEGVAIIDNKIDLNNFLFKFKN